MRRAFLPAISVFVLAACSSTEGGPSGSSATDSGSSGDGSTGRPEGGPPEGGVDDGAIPDAGETPISDGATDAPSDGGGSWLIPPAIACAPAAPTCPEPAASDTTVRASYRKDAWLPSYQEDGDAPTSGGRFHVAAIAATTGTITKVTVDGLDVSTLATPDLKPSIEWAHVWPKKVVAGEPVWIQFHSRAAKWDSASTGAFKIETDAGVAAEGTFPVAKTTVPITWVTTTPDRATALVHVQNRDTAARTIERLLVNGRDVTASACLAEKTLAAGETTLITIPLCAPWKLGDAWTVAVEYADAPTAVGVGRVVTPVYPIEAWNNTGECPWPGPGGKAANYEAIVKNGGVDTLYTHAGVCGACGCDTYTLLNDTLPKAGIRTLVTSDLGKSTGKGTKLTNLASVAAFSTGDESDGSVFVDASGSDDRQVSAPAKKANDSEDLWGWYPEVPTFNGGKTNKNIGTFAGMADVQGMDFYIGACAPHITRFGTDYPLRGPYDYLKNTRENHMPLPTWLYAQGLSPAWHKEVEVSGVKLVDYYASPSASEILVQGMHVVAAGAKGFLWFQVNQDRAKESPAAWQAIVKTNAMVRRVREHLREGDVAGLAKTSGKALVEAIRARDAIVVPVVDEDTTAKPTDVACNTATSAAAVPRWKFAAQTLAVEVSIPNDFGVAEVFEITADGPKDFTSIAASGRTLTLSSVALDEATPVRLFVIARTKEVRAAAAK